MLVTTGSLVKVAQAHSPELLRLVMRVEDELLTANLTRLSRLFTDMQTQSEQVVALAKQVFAPILQARGLYCCHEGELLIVSKVNEGIPHA